jgi:hypothetical protein
MKLFRPVGRNELEKMRNASMRAFPPRLPEQPIFYPVLNFEYAEQIARDWNSTRENHGFVGYVTEFEVEDDVVARYAVQTAGAASVHRELWVPAEELEEFNRHIVGEIRVVATYRNGARTSD